MGWLWYFRHFVQGRINAHQTPQYRISSKQGSPQQRAIFRAISLIILVAYFLFAGMKEYDMHCAFRNSYADPMYGVWDAQSNITFGNYRLDTLGIDRADFAHEFVFGPLIYVALAPTDKSAPPDVEIGKSEKNTIKFSMPDDRGKSTDFTVTLTESHMITLAYMHNGQPIAIHYHRRSIHIHTFRRSIFDEDYPHGFNRK